MSSAPVIEQMPPCTTFPVIAERIWDDIPLAAYAPGRERRPENAAAAALPSRRT